MSITLWQRGADELNIAQLSLISIQTRLPDTFVDWEDTFTVGDRPVMVQATAGKLGLPHGIDVDTNAALINLFLEQGCPADNAVRVSSYELLQGMGLDDSGTNYALLHESLQRMYLASYTIQGWFDHDGGMVIRTTLRLIDKVSDMQRGDKNLFGRPFGRNAVLIIALPVEIASNIRSGHLRAFDRNFMRALNSPLTRGLFRLLDAASDVSPVFEVGLMDWAKRCRLAFDVPARIRRTLEPAHAELQEQGFLKRVVYEGRGKAQTVRYEFNRQRPDFPMTEVQLKLIGQLKALGVAPPQAEAFVRGHSEAQVQERAQLAELIVTGTRNIKRQGGLVWDILNNKDGKYVTPKAKNAETPPDAPQRARTARQSTVEEIAPSDPWSNEVYLQQTPDERAAATVRSLKVLLHRAVSDDLYRQVAVEVRSGRIEGRDLFQEAARACKELKLQEFIDDLRQLVGQPTEA